MRLLEVSGIDSYYGDSHILFDLSLEVAPGEVVCLLSRNGCLVGPNGCLVGRGGCLVGRGGHVVRRGLGVPSGNLVPRGRRLVGRGGRSLAPRHANRRG